MSVFKGNMILLKRNIGLGIMYLLIFLFISILMQASGQKQEDTLTFEVVNSRVGIVDLDHSALSKGLIKYLENNNTVVMYENDKEVLIEALYYEDVYSIIVIPENFYEDCLNGKGVVDITNAPNTTNAIYVDMDINKYIFQIQTLKAALFTDEEAMQSAIANAKIESQVELIETGSERTEVASHNFFFRYSPYVYLSVLILMLGNILMPRNQKDMSQRLKCSAISETRQSVETFLSFGVAGIIVFAILIMFATVFYGNELYQDNLVVYYLLNSFIFMVVSLSISFMIASVAKGQASLSGFSNVVALGLCFMGGVFVPLQFLGEGIVKVAKFLPTYWYEVNVSMLGEYNVLKDSQIEKYRDGIFVQLAIAAVCVAIAFMINNKKEAHVN